MEIVCGRSRWRYGRTARCTGTHACSIVGAKLCTNTDTNTGTNTDTNTDTHTSAHANTKCRSSVSRHVTGRKS